MIKTKRVYDPPAKDDGFRVLVDQLWPRGIAKENAKIDLWLREIAPSDDLRKWFSHEAKKWEGFKKKYETELKAKQELLLRIKALEKDKRNVTILYSAKD
jgi:uncharacterized protein YeaO (DUF488 family)